MSELDKDWAVIEAWEDGAGPEMTAAMDRASRRWPAAVRALREIRDIIMEHDANAGHLVECECALCELAWPILAEVDREEEP